MSATKCVIYCRVSSGSQLDGGGLTSQESTCRKHAKHRNREVIEIFSDGGVSGGVLDRPGIQDLFKFVQKHNSKHQEKIQYFLCSDIDRLARGVEVHWQLNKVIHIGFEIMKKPLYFRQNGSIDEKRLLVNILFRSSLSVIREKEKFGTIPISPLFKVNQLFLDTKLQHLETIGTISNNTCQKPSVSGAMQKCPSSVPCSLYISETSETKKILLHEGHINS